MSVHDCFLNMLDVLFKEDLVGMWSTMHPSEEQNLQSLSKAPSSGSDKRYCTIPGIDRCALQHIGDSLRVAFIRTVKVFWKTSCCNFDALLHLP